MIKGIAYFLIFMGFAGIGGAVDLAESPVRAILMFVVGCLLLLAAKKGERGAETTCTTTYHDASYPSYLGRR